MKRFSPSTRHGWTFLAAALSFIEPSISGAQATSLRVGTNSPASSEVVLFSIAKDAGILKQHQLDVEVIYIAGGTLSMQALVGRSLDFMCTGGTFIYAYLEGVQAKILGGVHNRLPYAFVAIGSTATQAQVKGKKIGISRFGSTDDYALKLALAQFGIHPKEVTILQTGGPGTRLSALRAGTIDATVLTSGLAQIAMKSGNNLLVDFGDKNIEVSTGRAHLTRRPAEEPTGLGSALHEGLSRSGAILQESARDHDQENHGAAQNHRPRDRRV